MVDKKFNEKKKIAFLTTIFPMEKSYLVDFFDSLLKQTFKKVDIIVVNDGFSNFDDIAKQYSSDLNIIELKYLNTPAKNREYGINYCIEKGYDVLVFGDSDDCFKENRIEKSLELLEDNEVVVNDLTLFDENGIYEEKYLSNRLRNRQIIDFEFIKDKNIFGLSNTAIRLNGLDKFNIDKDLIAVDWYIFSIILLKNKRAVFTSETVSYYRQYGENTIGLKKINEEAFNKILFVRKQQYDNLNKFNYISDLMFDRLDYIKFCNLKNIKYPLWWELA
ncbi:glycosyltransferase [Campylobacter concisus]|jgi:hypothetical protein|uniref:glycosyltransferase n=1 Tax=Campylobacter concisus TaxID=199 RepID=UPI000D2F58A8|nr:glycosyltransferase [Campylobacter concisus]